MSNRESALEYQESKERDLRRDLAYIEGEFEPRFSEIESTVKDL